MNPTYLKYIAVSSFLDSIDHFYSNVVPTDRSNNKIKKKDFVRLQVYSKNDCLIFLNMVFKSL